MELHSPNWPAYGIIVLLSVLIGIIYIYKSLKKEKINDKRIFLFFFMMFVFAFVFGKIYTLLTDPDVTSFLKAGLSSYGGLIGVVISAIYFELILPTDKKIIKYSIISLPLIYSLSKIGCTVAGCCGGIPYKGLFNVTYVDRMNIQQFPVQALEVIVFMIIFIVCNKFKANKYITYITMSAVAIFKFLLDFLRYDHVTKMITVNQIFSIILLAIVIIVFIINKNKKEA